LSTARPSRTAIFGLEGSLRADGGLRQQILAMTSGAAAALGVDPHVLLDGPVDAIADDVGNELLVVLGEALTNVARHAEARRVDVEVTAGTDLVLRVIDDSARAAPGAVGRGQGTGQHDLPGIPPRGHLRDGAGSAFGHRSRMAGAVLPIRIIRP
jgi:signal transduction histidine kinase